MNVELGIIEGYYGRPWSWEARRAQVTALAPYGYRFYIYAPKADPYLRRRWQEPHPEAFMEEARAFALHCQASGVRFGVGLSPFELYRKFDDAARAALSRKLADLDAIGVQDLAILFDDMRGDLPNLAASQVDILHWIAARTKADRMIACPTYYSDDPGLDTAFGRRPERYLETFGSALDPAIEIFWTGEEVCSRELSPSHLARVADQIGRAPFIWDNYPVNDGPRMSPYLHLRAFTGRPAAMASHVAAHAINPALQPGLTRIPAITLADSYRLGADYAYGAAFVRAAEIVLGAELARAVGRHLSLFNDTGVDRISQDAVARLRARYAAVDHLCAREIVDWLDGVYAITAEMIETS